MDQKVTRYETTIYVGASERISVRISADERDKLKALAKDQELPLEKYSLSSICQAMASGTLLQVKKTDLERLRKSANCELSSFSSVVDAIASDYGEPGAQPTRYDSREPMTPVSRHHNRDKIRDLCLWQGVVVERGRSDRGWGIAANLRAIAAGDVVLITASDLDRLCEVMGRPYSARVPVFSAVVDDLVAAYANA